MSIIASKKIKEDGIYFCGHNAVDVTGSMTYIKYAGKNILLECGLYQSSGDYLEAYKINSAKFKFNPAEIDYIFQFHSHVDHSGNLPRLLAQGFHGKIICTYATAEMNKHLLLNCCAILADEARVLSKRYKREYKALYNEEDVRHTLELIECYDEYNTVFKLDDKVSFQLFRNSHCVGAVQGQIILNDGINPKKILYTSDIGALNTNNHYVVNTEVPAVQSDISIMESTYGDSSRINKKTREFDNKHLKAAIETQLLLDALEMRNN